MAVKPARVTKFDIDASIVAFETHCCIIVAHSHTLVVSACLPYPISFLRRCFGFDAILALSHKLVSIYLGILVTRSSDRTALSHKFVAMYHGILEKSYDFTIGVKGQAHPHSWFCMLVVFHSQEVFWN